MTRRLSWKIGPGNPAAVVVLSGTVDEDADFAALSRDIAAHRHLRIDLSEIGGINSCGVREWVNFIRGLPPDHSVELQNCSPAFVSQINMISNFTGRARVLSVQAPYVCDACHHEASVAFDVSHGSRPEVPVVKCSACGAPMAFDDIEDDYFAFLT